MKCLIKFAYYKLLVISFNSSKFSISFSGKYNSLNASGTFGSLCIDIFWEKVESFTSCLTCLTGLNRT